MNHEMAIQILAAESYALGDMTPSEREEFEQHFFECAECAEDVRNAVELMDAARVAGTKMPRPVLAQPVPSTRWSWLRPQFAAGLITALAAACIIEAVFIPSLQRRLTEADQPRVASSAFLAPQTRGASKVLKAAEGAPVILMFDLPESASGKLQFVLKDQDGRVEDRMFADAPPSGQSVTLSIPRLDLKPGEYLLVVESPTPAGQDGQELSRYPFELQRP